MDGHRSEIEPIEKATVLHGHVGPDTAYVVEDYPYGRTQRRRIRYWIDTARWNAKRGQRRFVLQATNPKVAGEPWGKPHPGKYHLLVWMYLDGKDGVRHVALDKYDITPAHDAWLRLTGIYDQIPPSDQEIYEALLRSARRNPDPWQKWATAIRLIVDHLDATGTPPMLDNGFVAHDRQRVYVGKDEYSLAVAIARQRRVN